MGVLFLSGCPSAIPLAEATCPILEAFRHNGANLNGRVYVDIDGFLQPTSDAFPNFNITNDEGCNKLLELGGDADYPYCYWEYKAEYSLTRIPQYLYKAQCRESCFRCPYGFRCEPVYYRVPIMTATGTPPDLERQLVHQIEANLTMANWVWSLEDVPVACACQRIRS